LTLRETAVAPPTGGRSARATGIRLPRAVSFVGVALVFVALFFAASAPSPLFVVFQEEWGFPAWMLTLAFAIYAVALLGALLITGSLSDHVGRRPVLIGALLLEAVSMAMFVVATDIAWIIAARIVQGIATGAATGAITAATVELAPERRKKLGTLMGSVAPLSGLALGALAAGFAVQVSATPGAIIFTLLGVIFLLGTIVIVLSPETVTRRPGAWGSLVPKVSVPPAARGEFAASIPVHIATWMLGGLNLGLVPSVIREIFHVDSGLLNGAAVALLAGAGAVAVYAFAAVPARTATILGTGALFVGTAILLTAITAGWFPLFFVGTIIAGVGFGTSFSGMLRLIAPLAEAHQRAELFAAVYTVSYLAFGVPAIIAGVLIGLNGLLSTVDAYGAVLLVAATLGLLAQTGRARRE